MRIAILGWGSLVWDPRSLRVAGAWIKTGPALKLEFSRISRDDRLTLVVDETAGRELPARFAISQLQGIEETVEDLARREGTSSINIGYVDLVRHTQHTRISREAVESIKEWAVKAGTDCVVWTDLASNFRAKKGFDFELEAALLHLQQLPLEVKKMARGYIRNAPPEIRTPLREFLVERHWVRRTRVYEIGKA